MGAKAPKLSAVKEDASLRHCLTENNEVLCNNTLYYLAKNLKITYIGQSIGIKIWLNIESAKSARVDGDLNIGSELAFAPQVDPIKNQKSKVI